MTFERPHDMASLLGGTEWPILRRVLSGGFLISLGEGGARALSLLAAIIAARILGVTDYGAFALVQGAALAVSTLAGFGLGHTAARYIAASRDSNPSRVENIIGLTWRISIIAGLVAAAAFWCLAPWIASTVLHNPDLLGMLRILAPFLVFNAVANAMLGTLQGFEAFSAIAKLNVLSGLMSFVCVTFGVVVGGVVGSIIGLLVSEIAKCGLVAVRVAMDLRRRTLSFLGPVDWRLANFVWTFSLPLLLGSMLQAPVMWFCQAMVSKHPGGLAEIGLYDVAQKVMTIVAFAPLAASAAVGPVLAHAAGAVGQDAVRSTTYRLAAVQFVLATLSAIGVALFAPTLASIFGPDFASVAPVIVVQMVLAPIFVLRHLFWQAVLADGRAWAVLWMSVLWSLVALFCTRLWQAQGALGLSKAMVVAYGVTLLCGIVLLERRSAATH